MPSTLNLGSGPRRIFLLSPANIAGIRARFVMREGANSEIAVRLRQGGVSLGEVFGFISALYFRGKLAYAREFSDPPPSVEGIFVITSSGGLVTPDALMTPERLREISSGSIDPCNSRYRRLLDGDARKLARMCGQSCQFILLGSVATPKYVEPLLNVFGQQLMFPTEFVGRGDMSRGGLMLRCAESGRQLTYIPVLGAVRRGPKPPKLTPLRRKKVPSAIDVVQNASPITTNSYTAPSSGRSWRGIGSDRL